MNFQEMINEHHHLHVLLDRARAVSAAPRGILPAPRWRNLVGHELRCLQKALDRHFAQEERGGYMSEVVARRPAFSRQVAALEQQHGEFRGGLTGLIGALAHDEEPELVRARLGALIGQLEAHEHAETELMQSAMLDDVGCGD